MTAPATRRTAGGSRPERPSSRRTPIVIGLVALAIAAVIAAWQIFSGGGAPSADVTGSPTGGSSSSTADGTGSADGTAGVEGTASSSGETDLLPPPAGTYAADPELLDVPRLDPADPTALGGVDAPVTMLIYSDYMCTFCKQFSTETLPELQGLVDAGILRIEWRDFTVYGQDAVNAATAGQAAANQGKFWPMHDWLFANQQPQGFGNVTEEFVTAGAEAVGLDIAQFAADFADADGVIYNSLVEDGQEVLGFAAPSTPTFLINGVVMVGAQPLDSFLDLISWAYQQEL